MGSGDGAFWGGGVLEWPYTAYPPPPFPHSVGLLLLYGALDSHPFFPSHVASGRCVLSAAAAGAPAGVVSAFAEPRRWCVGAALNVAGCAVCCASAAPSSWRIGGCAGCCGGRLTVLSPHLRPQAIHNRPSCVFVCVTRPKRPPRETTKFTIGNSLPGHFGTQTFGTQSPLPPPPSNDSLGTPPGRNSGLLHACTRGNRHKKRGKKFGSSAAH